jgi:hypothetical protein
LAVAVNDGGTFDGRLGVGDTEVTVNTTVSARPGPSRFRFGVVDEHDPPPNVHDHATGVPVPLIRYVPEAPPPVGEGEPEMVTVARQLPLWPTRAPAAVALNEYLIVVLVVVGAAVVVVVGAAVVVVVGAAVVVVGTAVVVVVAAVVGGDVGGPTPVVVVMARIWQLGGGGRLDTQSAWFASSRWPALVRRFAAPTIARQMAVTARAYSTRVAPRAAPRAGCVLLVLGT